MCYIQLSKGRYYKGFDSCIKINEKEVIVTEIKDNIEYTYILGKCAFEEAKAFLRGSHKSGYALSRYKMSQDIYNARLIRFVNQVATNYEDFTFTDTSKIIQSKFAILGYFRGSLELSPEAFSHKIIEIHATKNSSL